MQVRLTIFMKVELMGLLVMVVVLGACEGGGGGEGNRPICLINVLIQFIREGITKLLFKWNYPWSGRGTPLNPSVANNY